MAEERVGERLRRIREARGEKQPEYAAALNAAAKRLRLSENYDGSKVSRMESGRNRCSLEDVLIIAATDPEKRGRDWLAWGESVVSVRESLIEKRPIPQPEKATPSAAKRHRA